MTLTLFAIACLLPLSLVSLALALWPGRKPRHMTPHQLRQAITTPDNVRELRPHPNRRRGGDAA